MTGPSTCITYECEAISQPFMSKCPLHRSTARHGRRLPNVSISTHFLTDTIIASLLPSL